MNDGWPALSRFRRSPRRERVSRAHCSVLHAAVQTRDPGFWPRDTKPGSRICTAPRASARCSASETSGGSELDAVPLAQLTHRDGGRAVVARVPEAGRPEHEGDSGHNTPDAAV